MRSARLGVLARGAITVVVAGGLALAWLPGKADAASPKMAQARRALLVLSDMPHGWKASKSSNGSSSFPGASQLAQCLGVPLSEVNDNPPSVNSEEFNGPNDVESVSDTVSVFPSAKAARADFEVGANPKSPRCLSANFNGPGRAKIASSFGAKATLGSITVTRTPSSDYAPHSLNYTLFFPVTTQGTTLNLELAEVVYVKGTEEQVVTFVTTTPPFPTSLSRRLTKVAAGRL
jgi:hypothetical protein